MMQEKFSLKSVIFTRGVHVRDVELGVGQDLRAVRGGLPAGVSNTKKKTSPLGVYFVPGIYYRTSGVQY